MPKGDRSQGTRSDILRAALRLMGRPDYLSSFGLQREALATAAGYSPGAVDYHVRGGKLAAGLLQLHRELISAVVEQHSKDYDAYTKDFIEPDGSNLRDVLKKALARDLRAYLPAQNDEIAVGRERLYWIAVALAGRPDLKDQPDLQDVLAETNARTQAEYRETYRAAIAAARRGPLPDQKEVDYDRIQRIGNAFLEGVIVHRRLAMPISDDDIVDGLLGIVHSMTGPA